MELSEATSIVKEANKVCPNLWFYIKTTDGQYIKKRLALTSKGELREYVKKRIDTLQPTDPSDWARLKPKYTSKVQLFKSNVSRILFYLSESGLWQSLIPELTQLQETSEDILLSLYNSEFPMQKDYLLSHGYKFITTQRLRSLLYDDKCIRPVYFGKDNLSIKKKYKEALEANKEFVFTWRMTYDNTIHYDPNTMTALYSEEFRGQHTGHYYILLDDMHAVFQQSIKIKIK